MRRTISVDIRASEGTTELTIRTAHSPPATKRGPPGRILRDVFPAGAWANPATQAKACAEYQYLRAAAGFCRSCPAQRSRYKHRCDVCQAKERKRWRAKQAAYNEARPRELAHAVKRPRRSKFRYAAIRWLRMKRRKGEL